MTRRTITILSFISLFLCSSLTLFSQKESGPSQLIEPGRFLFQLSQSSFVSEWLRQVNQDFYPLELNHEKVLSSTINAHLLTLKSNPENLSDKEILAMLANRRHLLYVGPDRYATYRKTEPDDPLYFDQWHLQQIMAPEVWEITKGGTTALGDTIVIAVLDSGCQLDHPDLQANIWRNRAEIPGNGIDDDGNGYIDDYFGLNVATGTDQHNASGHGTEVAGVAAAVTNNAEGVSSLAWNSRVMIVSKSGGGWLESEAVEAMEYVLEQRRRYNQSNGASGAFVVSANLSFGWNSLMPEDLPLLCEMFNALGMEGIIGVAATTNSNTNVDTFGDLPTTCPSPYLLSVTSSDRDDRKANTGYGKINIDLAAPGRQIMTTTTPSNYFATSGTSVAAPQVAAAVALLYSVDCFPFAQIAKTSPSEAALIVKNAILSGVDKNENLQEFTASGGRLNLFNSLLNLSNCETDLDELAILNIYPNPFFDEINIEFRTPDFEKYELQITDMLGRRVLSTKFSTLPFTESVLRLELSQLPVGMYLLHITETEGRSAFTIIKGP